MRIKLLVIISLFICSTCFAGTLYIPMCRKGGPAAPACSQGAASADSYTADSYGNEIVVTNAFGCEFVAQASYSSWGLTVWLSSDNLEGATVEFRVGTSSDLSTYMGKMQLTVEATESTAYTGQWLDSGDSATCIDFAASTTYYIGAIKISGTYTPYWHIYSTKTANATNHYADSGWALGDSDADWDDQGFSILLNGE